MEADGAARAKEHVERALSAERLEYTERAKRSQKLEELKRRFFALHESDDRQGAGRELQRILSGLFELHGLNPKEAFRVVGEEIDGSFELDHEVYLVEAKWTADPIPESPLLVFREKVEGKSKYTRGVFVSINGISDQARDAITRGKQPNFFVIDGFDITMLLEDNIDLCRLLRERQRLLADKGAVVVPFKDVFGDKEPTIAPPE